MRYAVDLPVTPEQAQLLMTEVALKPNEPEPVKVSRALAVGDIDLPGRWIVYAVRRESGGSGEPQHWASFEWVN
jgi:hypothetical protein